MDNTIIYETHCITHLSKEFSEYKQELIQQHLDEINRKFNLLLEGNEGNNTDRTI